MNPSPVKYWRISVPGLLKFGNRAGQVRGLNLFSQVLVGRLRTSQKKRAHLREPAFSCLNLLGLSSTDETVNAMRHTERLKVCEGQGSIDVCHWTKVDPSGEVIADFEIIIQIGIGLPDELEG